MSDKNREYAIYKGDKLLFIGSRKECAEHFHIKEKTINWMTNPSVHKRADNKTPKWKKNSQLKIAIPLWK